MLRKALHNRASIDEQSPLLSPNAQSHGLRSGTQRRSDEEDSIIESHVSTEEQALGGSSVGERLPYNDYATIDWPHDLIKDSYRSRLIRRRKALKYRLYALFDQGSGWIAVALIGSLTACVAFLVDIAEATVSDWKLGYCTKNPLMDRRACCLDKTPLFGIAKNVSDNCESWHEWSRDYWKSFGIYLGFALAFGVISATATTFTKRSLPAAMNDEGDKIMHESNGTGSKPPTGKAIYMAAGSGIPEIKTILGGFVIPHFLDFKVLFVKAFGAVFAVATGMCLGKEGPFVHISGCVGYLIASCFPKYRENGRKMRELLSASVAAGLSVAFGAPIGGVLFSYEEISTYFPRKVLWKAFLCSLSAAVLLKALNPTGTGKLVLFETDYGTSYLPQHYAIFVLLGVAGGLWGGLFCRLNFMWSKWFRSFSIIKKNPVLEVFLVVLVTVLLQYPNPITREPGDEIIRNLLVDCGNSGPDVDSWVCRNEAVGSNWRYTGWLAFGCVVKLVLTVVTFGAKVPSGIIIPAMDAGSLFGRLIGQWLGTISPGIFAMVGAAAFLAGVSRMTISLCVIMFELTGEVEYIVPHMIAILIAKWVADSLSRESVYDLAQNVLGHPFLDMDHATQLVQAQDPPHLVNKLIPSAQTMSEITVQVDRDNKASRVLLERKLAQLQARGLIDAGLVLVQGDRLLQGYLAEGELEFGLKELGKLYKKDIRVKLLGDNVEDAGLGHEGRRDVEEPQEESINALTGEGKTDGDLDLSPFVDRTPLTMSASAPMEYAVECFGKLGLRYLMVTEEGTGKLVGVVVKKRLVAYLESLD